MRIFFLCRGRSEAFSHDNKRGDDLSRNGGDCCAGNTQPRQSEQTENQQRIEDDVGNRSKDLCDHRCFHVAVRLNDLCPDTFQKQTEAEYADNASVGIIIGNQKYFSSRKFPCQQEELWKTLFSILYLNNLRLQSILIENESPNGLWISMKGVNLWI